MANKINLGSIDEIPAGEGRNFTVGGVTVAVFRCRDGSVYATQAECPHRQGPLADGLVGPGTVICPLHEKLFDLRTGQSQDGTCSLARYPVASEDGRLVLELPE